MAGKKHTLSAIESLRSGIVSGERVELQTVVRQHLESGSSLVSEISFDAKHRPMSTNTSRHLQRVRTLADETDVAIATFLPLKRKPNQKESSPAALLMTVDPSSKLTIHNLDGEVLLGAVDLGHAPGRTVTKVQLSPSQENHFVLTADDSGEMRVHNLKIMARREKKEEKEKDEEKEEKEADEEGKEAKDDDEEKARRKPQLIVSTNFSCSFAVPQGEDGEVEDRKLTAVMPMDRGAQTYFVAGDSLGGISVFFRNGTLKGRVVVTGDEGGIRGLQRAQGQTVLFFSSHSFGFFSTSQLDLQHAPCDGWESPLYDLAQDQSGGNRIILALEDGDVLVYSTQKGNSKACDLALKFPHVSRMPMQIQLYRGHVIALPVPHANDPEASNQEILFFNLAAMDSGYGSSPSKAIALQASFKPQQPLSFALHTGQSGGSGGQSRALLALRMAGARGVELYELALKQPPGASGGGGGGGAGVDSSSSWLNWFPKIGVFGIALVGVVIWNVRKVTAQKRHDKLDDFDEEYFKEKLRERKKKKEEEAGDGGDGDDKKSPEGAADDASGEEVKVSE